MFIRPILIRYSHSKSPKIFDNKIYILRHQEKCLAIKVYILVMGNFSVLNSYLLFQLDFIKISMLFLTLWVLCCVVSFWFQQYVKNHENFSRLLKKSRKGDLVIMPQIFGTHLIALFEFLHEGKTDTFKG